MQKAPTWTSRGLPRRRGGTSVGEALGGAQAPRAPHRHAANQACPRLARTPRVDGRSGDCCPRAPRPHARARSDLVRRRARCPLPLGGVAILALYVRGTPVRQGEPAPAPARDPGLFWLGAAVALWGVVGGLLLLPLPDCAAPALRTVLSSANSACLLISASHLDYGPTWLQRASDYPRWNQAALVGSFAVALLTIVLYAALGPAAHIARLPDFLLSAITLLLYGFEVFCSFRRRGFMPLAVLAGLAVLLQFAAQLPEIADLGAIRACGRAAVGAQPRVEGDGARRVPLARDELGARGGAAAGAQRDSLFVSRADGAARGSSSTSADAAWRCARRRTAIPSASLWRACGTGIARTGAGCRCSISWAPRRQPRPSHARGFAPGGPRPGDRSERPEVVPPRDIQAQHIALDSEALARTPELRGDPAKSRRGEPGRAPLTGKSKAPRKRVAGCSGPRGACLSRGAPRARLVSIPHETSLIPSPPTAAHSPLSLRGTRR